MMSQLETLPDPLFLLIILVFIILGFPMLLILFIIAILIVPSNFIYIKLILFPILLIMSIPILLIYHYLIAWLVLFLFRLFLRLLRRITKDSIIILTLISVVAATIFFTYFHRDFDITPYLILNYILFSLFVYLDVYIHEIGHVIAAKIANLEVRRVMIGSGRELFRKKIFDIDFIITDNFAVGQTFLGHVEKKLLKLRFFIIISGGNFIQILLILICFYIYGFEEKNFLIDIYLPGVFIISNLFITLFSLIPIEFNYRGVTVINDGLRMIRAPFLSENETQEILSTGYNMEAFELYEKGEYVLAAEAFKKCTELYPEQTGSKIGLSASLLELLKLEEAIGVLQNLVENCHEEKYKSVIYNNLAWVLLLKDNKKSIQDADKYSKMAFDLNSKLPYIRNTRGSVLIEIGHIEEGIKILEKTITLKKSIDRRTNNAAGFIFLTYGYFLKGEKDKVKKYLDHLSKYSKQMNESERYVFDIIKKKTNNFHGII